MSERSGNWNAPVMRAVPTTSSTGLFTLEKAAFLMLLRPIETLGEDHYRIGSEDGLRLYEVINGHCECSDYLRHGPGHPCKHRLALAFYQKLDCFELPFPSGEPKFLHKDQRDKRRAKP